MKRKLNANDIPESASMSAETTAVKSTAATAHSPPIRTNFASLELDATLMQAITRQKFAAPTPVQAKAIPLVLNGKHVLARAKTGSGKTLAYLLPVIHHIVRSKAVSKPSKQTSALILVPTKELATQVADTIKTYTAFCARQVRCENITRKEDTAVTTARLAEGPDIVVATPSRASSWINQEVLKVDELKHLVIDEADLLLSYDYKEDLENIAQILPSGIQKVMMSATLRSEVSDLTDMFFTGHDGIKPEILDLSSEEAAEKPTLAQYTVRTAEDEKFLLIYAIFKLQLIKGKIIVFVADIDRCYRIKLFLEQFGIRSCVLNSELPVNSRLHVVEEFNKGVYDIIIAADEAEVVGNEDGSRKKRKTELREDVEEGTEDVEKSAQPDAEKDSSRPEARQRRSRIDREYGVSRGIDFRHVTCVLNFDLPSTSKSYTHRIGRTARAGQSGMALSFYVPRDLFRKHKPTSIAQSENDEQVLGKIIKKQAEKGSEVKEWGIDWTKLDGFRYRLADALRAVTRIAVREARTKELRCELIKSEKLKRHFEENPDDLRHLRHDTDSHAVRVQPHLRHVPDYLLPSGGKAAVSKDVGSVGMRRDNENRIRKARALNKSRGKGRLGRGKGSDPLKKLNARGRGKK